MQLLCNVPKLPFIQNEEILEALELTAFPHILYMFCVLLDYHFLPKQLNLIIP